MAFNKDHNVSHILSGTFSGQNNKAFQEREQKKIKQTNLLLSSAMRLALSPERTSNWHTRITGYYTCNLQQLALILFIFEKLVDPTDFIRITYLVEFYSSLSMNA